MGPAAERHAHTQGPAPEALLAVELPHVEKPAADFGDPAEGDLDQWLNGNTPALETGRRISRRVDGPASDPQNRGLQVRPQRAKIRDPLLFRPLGPLESIMETVPARTPCTLSQDAGEDEESPGLRGSGPLDQRVRRSPLQHAIPAGGEAP